MLGGLWSLGGGKIFGGLLGAEPSWAMAKELDARIVKTKRASLFFVFINICMYQTLV
jgi:hypothetical protein